MDCVVISSRSFSRSFINRSMWLVFSCKISYVLLKMKPMKATKLNSTKSSHLLVVNTMVLGLSELQMETWQLTINAKWKMFAES